jgi:hypothetical protein
MSAKDITADIRSDEGVEAYIESNGPQEYIDKTQLCVEYDIGETKAKRVKKILKQDVDRDLL